jgi:hypothetical protein
MQAEVDSIYVEAALTCLGWEGELQEAEHALAEDTVVAQDTWVGAGAEVGTVPWSRGRIADVGNR